MGPRAVLEGEVSPSLVQLKLYPATPRWPLPPPRPLLPLQELSRWLLACSPQRPRGHVAGSAGDAVLVVMLPPPLCDLGTIVPCPPSSCLVLLWKPGAAPAPSPAPPPAPAEPTARAGGSGVAGHGTKVTQLRPSRGAPGLLRPHRMLQAHTGTVLRAHGAAGPWKQTGSPQPVNAACETSSGR